MSRVASVVVAIVVVIAYEVARRTGEAYCTVHRKVDYTLVDAVVPSHGERVPCGSHVVASGVVMEPFSTVVAGRLESTVTAAVSLEDDLVVPVGRVEVAKQLVMLALPRGNSVAVATGLLISSFGVRGRARSHKCRSCYASATTS